MMRFCMILSKYYMVVIAAVSKMAAECITCVWSDLLQDRLKRSEKEGQNI